MVSMRAVVYPPPSEGLPHLAVVFHTDGSIALTRPFLTAENAQRYIMDVESSVVTIDPQIA